MKRMSNLSPTESLSDALSGYTEYMAWRKSNPTAGRLHGGFHVLLYDVGGVSGLLLHLLAFILFAAGLLFIASHLQLV